MEPDIAVDDSGNFIITWYDYRNGHTDIYAQRYSANGNAVEGNFQVNDDFEWHDQGYPSIAMDDLGNCIITWEDYRNGGADIYAQRYDNNGTALGANFRVTSIATKAQLMPAVALASGKIYNTWRSNYAGGTGYDIWANVLDWNAPTAIADEYNDGNVQVSSSYRLGQNYPNPFNPVTTIEYQLPRESVVSINIYNITGELIRTIVSQQQAAGAYRIQWDGRDNYGHAVAGGVYLYQLQAGDFMQSNKMVLLR